MSFPNVRPLLLAGAVAIGAVLSGCVATPIDPYYGGAGYGYGYGADYGYSNYGYSGYGYPAGSAGFGYYGAAPVVVAPVGIGLGFSGVFGSHGHRGDWDGRGYGNGYRGGYRPNYGGGFRPGYGAVKPQPGVGGGWGVRPNGGGGGGRVGGNWGRR
ncbi:MAG: hypothetical protein ABJB17_08020 [Burkholderiales bacterium]